jgi:hypothetical protein
MTCTPSSIASLALSITFDIDTPNLTKSNLANVQAVSSDPGKGRISASTGIYSFEILYISAWMAQSSSGSSLFCLPPSSWVSRRFALGGMAFSFVLMSALLLGRSFLDLSWGAGAMPLGTSSVAIFFRCTTLTLFDSSELTKSRSNSLDPYPGKARVTFNEDGSFKIVCRP